MTKLRKLRELTPRERGALLRASVLLPLVALALRAVGFERTRKILERSGRRGSTSKPAEDELRAVSRMVRIAARHLPLKSGCLPQSLVAWRLLRRRGVTCELRFGARREGSRVLAHAWVELPGGERFDTDSSGAYSSFPAGSTDLGGRE